MKMKMKKRTKAPGCCYLASSTNLLKRGNTQTRPKMTFHRNHNTCHSHMSSRSSQHYLRDLSGCGVVFSRIRNHGPKFPKMDKGNENTGGFSSAVANFASCAEAEGLSQVDGERKCFSQVPKKEGATEQLMPFAFQLHPDDVLLEMFKGVGGQCLKCCSVVENPNEMCLCQGCQSFTCVNCFLEGCACSKKTNYNLAKTLKAGSGLRDVAAKYQYVTYNVKTEQVCLDGEPFQMETHFKSHTGSGSKK